LTALKSAGRAFEALRGSRWRSTAGVSVYRYKVYACDQRRICRSGGLPYAYSEQYISEHLQLRADRAVPAGGHHGGARPFALLGAAIIVILPKLLDDLECFAVALATLTHAAARIRKITTPKAAFRWSAPLRWRFRSGCSPSPTGV
jgi:branched-chain amino acid transport system permease protein